MVYLYLARVFSFVEKECILYIEYAYVYKLNHGVYPVFMPSNKLYDCITSICIFCVSLWYV